MHIRENVMMDDFQPLEDVVGLTVLLLGMSLVGSRLVTWHEAAWTRTRKRAKQDKIYSRLAAAIWMGSDKSLPSVITP